jgi:hypothetical protein
VALALGLVGTVNADTGYCIAVGVSRNYVRGGWVLGSLPNMLSGWCLYYSVEYIQI